MDRATAWIRLLGTVSAAQVLTQGIGFLGGIVIVRCLAPDQYALYTLALTMISALTVIADGGVASGLMAEGGKVWQSASGLGSVLATGLTLRRRLVLWAAVICAPALAFLMRSHGISWNIVTIMFAALLATLWLTTLNTLYGIAPALHQRVLAIQNIGLIQGGLRLVLLCALLCFWPNAILAVAAAVLPLAWSVMRLRRMSHSFADLGARADDDIRRSVLKVVQRVLPGSVYLCVSNQVSIWLISVLGSTLTLAQIGALGRIGQAFAVLPAVTSALFAPRFARLAADGRTLLVRYLQVLAVMTAFCSVLIAIVLLLPGQVLAIIGPHYANLRHELILQMFCSALWLLAATAYNLGCVRGIVVKPFLSVGVQIACQIALFTMLDVSSLRGALWFSIAMGTVQLIIYGGNVVAALLAAEPRMAA
jgi:O-antigen/teichoic acid export membrane protein